MMLLGNKLSPFSIQSENYFSHESIIQLAGTKVLSRPCTEYILPYKRKCSSILLRYEHPLARQLKVGQTKLIVRGIIL